MGRLQTKTFENDEQEYFNWDPAGNLISFQSPATLVERFYDDAGNLTAEKNNAATVQYLYDGNNQRTLRTTSHGNRVEYGYDNRGLVNFIHINDELPLTIDRNHQGQVIAEHFSRYLERTFDYDAEGRLSRQTITGVSGRIHRSYTYDPAGNLTAKHDSLKGPRHCTYDPMGRITQSIDPENRIDELLYDPAGDLLKHLPETDTDLRHADFNHTRYSFNAAGNLVERRSRDTTARLAWDDQNRLTAIRTSTGDQTTYTYDALGRRRQKNVNGKRTTFTWDGDALLAEQNEDGAVREYVYYPGTFEPLALIDPDGQVYYYHNDVNGLPQELTRSNGDIVWSADYDALGRVEKLLVEDVVQPLRMQGQYYDQETGLCYNRYRYFDPNSCSFISQDPVGLAAGENVYGYAPNVWGWVDPLGLCPKSTSSGNRAITDPRKLLPAPTRSNPYPDGDKLFSQPAPRGTVIEMAMSPGQPASRPGGFGTPDIIPNAQYVRDDLALTHGFKAKIGYVQRYEVEEGVFLQYGRVGPQMHGGRLYQGEGRQVEILNFSDRSKLRPIGNPIPISD